MGKKRLGRLGTASERGRGEATTSLAVLCCVLAGLGSIHRMFALHEPDSRKPTAPQTGVTPGSQALGDLCEIAFPPTENRMDQSDDGTHPSCPLGTDRQQGSTKQLHEPSISLTTSKKLTPAVGAARTAKHRQKGQQGVLLRHTP